MASVPAEISIPANVTATPAPPVTVSEPNAVVPITFVVGAPVDVISKEVPMDPVPTFVDKATVLVPVSTVLPTAPVPANPVTTCSI